MKFAMNNKCGVVNVVCDKVAGSGGAGVKGLHSLTDCVAKKSMVDSECTSVVGSSYASICDMVVSKAFTLAC